jgi:glyceraldehyde 3-phosphate dehydrogenase
VIISAPTKDEQIKTIVLGVNHNEITAEDQILSNASCTTNCIAPIMKVLEDNFGVEKSLMSTIHSYTSTQNLVDGDSKKDLRRGRAAAQNTIPASTGAAIATTKTLPQLIDKFDGMAFRVPTVVGSISDVVAVVKREVTVGGINDALTKSAQENLKGILSVTDEPLVTHDIIGNPHSVIVQTELTKVIGGNLVKVVGWYDNEWGYSNRLVELAEFVGKKI